MPLLRELIYMHLSDAVIYERNLWEASQFALLLTYKCMQIYSFCYNVIMHILLLTTKYIQYTVLLASHIVLRCILLSY
jgi:hypothetical protein